MNLLDCANALLKGSGQKPALTVLALAILAAPAAKAISTTDFTVIESGVVATGIPSGYVIGWDALPPYQGVSGISLYADGIAGDLPCYEGRGCSGAAAIYWMGNFAGGVPSFPGPVPLSWEFSASPQFTWYVTFDVGRSQVIEGQLNPATAGGSTVSGATSVLAGSTNFWLVQLNVSWNDVSDSRYSVQIPRHLTLDVNNFDDAVPEPATLLLVGPALGLLLLKSRRARR